jgi:hypothetical protein
MFAFYESKYGVGSAFFRFLRDVLPTEARRTLLNSFQLVRLSNPPELGEAVPLADPAKERYLYEIRNSYTHRAQFAPGPDLPDVLPGALAAKVREQWVDAIGWTTVKTVNWPAALVDVVKAGCVAYMGAVEASK